jgi:glycosyltransferase involved in cell wall biosynthesis
VGYVGTFRNVIDVGFFKKLIEGANVRLVLAGPFIGCSPDKRRDFESLFAHEHVEYRGNLSEEDAFNTINEIDVGLLPYEVTLKTKHNFVIKYFEYLALGKPMVATPYFDWPEPYNKFVTVVNNGETLQDTLRRAYDNWTDEKFKHALDFARKNTWDDRIKTLSHYIERPL